MKRIIPAHVYDLFLYAIAVVFLLAAPGLSAETPEKTLVLENFRCLETEQNEAASSLPDSAPSNAQNACRIGDWVIVDVTADSWMNWQNANKAHVPENLILSLNGYLLYGRTARYLPSTSQLRIALQRNHNVSANTASWKSLLPRTNPLTPKVMAVSLALEADGISKRYFAEDTKEIMVWVASPFRVGISGVVMAVLLIIFVRAVMKYGLLREGEIVADLNRKRFSLGRTQMAVWTFIVVASFLYIWLVLDDINVLNGSVLALIGISIVTGGVASILPGEKDTSENLSGLKLTLETESSELKAQIVAEGDPSAKDNLAAQQAVIAEQIGELDDAISKKRELDTQSGRSARFLNDLLSSKGEVTLPRFQMFAWTLVLGIVFVHRVFTNLSMPEFDATLLGLMGISSGTYVGFKFPQLSGR